METLLTNLGLVVTDVIGIVADVVVLIVAQPLLLIPVGVSFLFAGVGLFKAIRS